MRNGESRFRAGAHARHRILLVDFAPSPGGSIVSLHGLVKGLCEDSYEPVVVLASGSSHVPRFRALGAQVFTMDVRQGQREAFSAPVEHLRTSGFADWVRRTGPVAAAWHLGGFWMRFWRTILPEARQIRDLAREHQAGLIHCNDALSISRSGVLGARLARLPCICHVRRFDRFGWFERWLMPSVDQFVFISNAVQQQFLAQQGRAAGHQIVFNGLDLEDFPVGIDGTSVRRELGLREKGPVVGIVGRLVDWKGHEVYLHALARVAETWPDVQGLIVGGVEVTNPSLTKELQELATALGLAEAVVFTGHRSDVSRMLAAMDVVAHASTSPEPFGRVIIEGMAMARPVVATSGGAVPEIVMDGQTGLLVEPGDVDGLAEAIVALLLDPERAASLGQAGRKRVEACFTSEHHVRQIEGVYGVVLGDS